VRLVVVWVVRVGSPCLSMSSECAGSECGRGLIDHLAVGWKRGDSWCGGEMGRDGFGVLCSGVVGGGWCVWVNGQSVLISTGPVSVGPAPGLRFLMVSCVWCFWAKKWRWSVCAVVLCAPEVDLERD